MDVIESSDSRSQHNGFAMAKDLPNKIRKAGKETYNNRTRANSQAMSKDTHNIIPVGYPSTASVPLNAKGATIPPMAEQANV